MKHNYTQPKSAVLTTQLQHAMCASDGVQSTSVSNITENDIWGGAPARHAIVH